jgi:hypothetical protein
LRAKKRKEAQAKEESTAKGADGAPPVKADETKNKKTGISNKIHKLSDKKDKVFEE